MREAAEPLIVNETFIFPKNEDTRLFILRKSLSPFPLILCLSLSPSRRRFFDADRNAVVNAERVALKSQQFASRLLIARRQIVMEIYDKFTKTVQRKSRRNTLF